MSDISAVVLMTVTMFLPHGTELKQGWQIVEPATLEHCIKMNEVFAQGGKAAVMTVRCEPIRPSSEEKK